jgi:hypothetical protein
MVVALGWSNLDRGTAKVATFRTEDLLEFKDAKPEVQRLIRSALVLTQENLTYAYGSSDPTTGGMDCSGTVYYLLEKQGLADVPRDSSEMYEWVWKSGQFRAVNSSNPETFEFAELKPGDLLFWTGTYKVTRDPPVTHVMIYLGTSRLTGKRVMVGASDGRTFNGVPQNGVSVFDFKLPRGDRPGVSSEAGSRFIGYGPIPNLGDTKPSSPPTSL